MSSTEAPLIPVFARWFGSWQVRVERRTLPPEALADAYDRAAPRWTSLVERLGYGRAYRHVRIRKTNALPEVCRPLSTRSKSGINPFVDVNLTAGEAS